MRQYRILIILSAVLYLACCLPCGAQTRILALEDAVRLSLEKNQELAMARLETDKSHARVTEAWSNTMPAVNFEGTYSRAIKKPVFFLPDFANPNSGNIIPIEIGTDHAINLNFTARQILFNSAVIIGVGASQVYSDAAHETYRAKRVETIAKVRKAFYAALLAEEVRLMMLENQKNAEDNLRNVELLSKQGLVSEYDQLRAQVGVANLRPAVLQAENGAILSIEALRAVVGLEVTEKISIKGELVYKQINEELVERSEEEAVRTNPTLSALKLAVDVNQAFVNVARSDYFPTLAAFGNYQYQAATNQFRISSNDFIRSSTVGLSLTMNLFQGFQTRARVEQAQLEKQKSEEQLSAFETGLKTGVHSLVLQLHQAQKRVEAQGKTEEQAQRGYKIASSRFANGSGTQLEVNDAQLALTQSKVNRIQAVYDYLVATADLEQALGIIPSYVPAEQP
ncbi:MAG TPA: TolC family protein [Bacteroidota bacterium]|nr:TolC family protein [Bacteroidota bacterium]